MAWPPPRPSRTTPPAYSQSKLANLLFTTELQRLQSHSGSRLTGFAMGTLGNRLLAQDAAGGALPTLYAAFADIPGGTFAGPSRLGGLRGAPAPCGRSKAARDTGVAARLWTVSETLTGAAFPRVQPPPVQPR